jgi:hypothetical protein
VIVSPNSVKLLLTALAEAAGQDVYSKTREELKIVLPKNKTLESGRNYFGNVLMGLKVRLGYSKKIDLRFAIFRSPVTSTLSTLAPNV